MPSGPFCVCQQFLARKDKLLFTESFFLVERGLSVRGLVQQTAAMCWTVDVRHVTLCDFRVMVVWFPALSLGLFSSGIFSLGRSSGVAWRQRPHGLWVAQRNR